MEKDAAMRFENLLTEPTAAQRERALALREKASELTRFGDGMVYSPEALAGVERELATLAQMDARMKWEIGRRLVWVQGHEPWLPGQQSFTQWLKEHTSFSRRTAFTYMAVARRLAALPESELAAMPAAKAYALLELTDEQIAEYASTGRIGNAEPDEIDLMSPEELRDLCRRQAGKIDKGRRQLDDLREKNERLEAEAGRRARAVDATFVTRIEGLILAANQMLELLDGATTSEELVQRAGDPEVARRLLLSVKKLIDQLNTYTMILQPKGRVREVHPGRVATPS